MAINTVIVFSVQLVETAHHQQRQRRTRIPLRAGLAFSGKVL
jgi:hypothetical protein